MAWPTLMHMEVCIRHWAQNEFSSEFATFVKCAIGMAFVPFLLVYFIFLLIPN